MIFSIIWRHSAEDRVVLIDAAITEYMEYDGMGRDSARWQEKWCDLVKAFRGWDLGECDAVRWVARRRQRKAKP